MVDSPSRRATKRKPRPKGFATERAQRYIDRKRAKWGAPRQGTSNNERTNDGAA